MILLVGIPLPPISDPIKENSDSGNEMLIDSNPSSSKIHHNDDENNDWITIQSKKKSPPP